MRKLFALAAVVALTLPALSRASAQKLDGLASQPPSASSLDPKILAFTSKNDPIWSPEISFGYEPPHADDQYWGMALGRVTSDTLYYQADKAGGLILKNGAPSIAGKARRSEFRPLAAFLTLFSDGRCAFTFADIPSLTASKNADAQLAIHDLKELDDILRSNPDAAYEPDKVLHMNERIGMPRCSPPSVPVSLLTPAQYNNFYQFKFG